MPQNHSQALDDPLKAWIPRLIGIYRAGRRDRVGGPADRLTADELASVARGVRRLSEGLTGRRRLIGSRYLDDADLRAAYLLYFWPISYMQGRQVLSEIAARPRAALDLGSGPGPLAMAAFDSGAAEVMAADRSNGALDLARTVADSAERSLVTRVWDGTADSIPGSDQAWSLITLGHTLNELWADAPDRIARRAALCQSLLTRLRKGGSLVIVEPALKTTTRELLQVRDALVAAGCVVRAPCLYRGACPALIKPEDWCHAERAWNPPLALAEVIEAAGFQRTALQMAYLIVAAPGSQWPSLDAKRPFRIVSEQLPGKSRLRVIGCGPEGRIPIALPDSVRNAAFVGARRGDVLDIEGAEPSAEGLGIRVTASTTVTVARKAGEVI